MFHQQTCNEQKEPNTNRFMRFKLGDLLTIQYQGLQDQDIPELVNFIQNSNIRKLNLTANFITHKGAALIATLQTITELNMRLNPLGDEGVIALAKNNNFKILKVSSTGMTERAAFVLAKNPSILSLDVSFNKINTFGLEAFLKNKTLIDLEFIGIPIKHFKSLQFFGLKNLAEKIKNTMIINAQNRKDTIKINKNILFIASMKANQHSEIRDSIQHLIPEILSFLNVSREESKIHFVNKNSVS